MVAVTRRVEPYATQVSYVGDGQRVRDAQAVVRPLAQQRTYGEASTGGVGGILYRVCWRQLWEGEFRGWLDSIALHKVWFSSGLSEWRIISRVSSYSTAHHALKFFAGGIASAAQRRGRVDRRRAHRCCRCRTGFGEVRWSRRCPTSAEDMLREAKRAPTVPVRFCAARAAGRAGAEHGIWATSSYEACPLRGAGESGSEQLFQWCFAVARAWRNISSRRDLAAAFVIEGDYDRELAHLLHQAAYFRGTMLDHVSFDWMQAGRVFIRAGQLLTLMPTRWRTVRQRALRRGPTTVSTADTAETPPSSVATFGKVASPQVARSARRSDALRSRDVHRTHARPTPASMVLASACGAWHGSA